jgi:hypothetical protein
MGVQLERFDDVFGFLARQLRKGSFRIERGAFLSSDL